MDIFIPISILHIIGAVLGVGGTSFADIYFLRNIKKDIKSIEESEAIKTAKLLIWSGLGLLLVSGLLMVSLWATSGNSEAIFGSKFLSKMTIVLVVLVNGVLLETKKIPVAIGGPLSTVSWYSALVLGGWRGLDLPYFVIIGIYLFMVSGAIVTFKLLRIYYKVNL